MFRSAGLGWRDVERDEKRNLTEGNPERTSPDLERTANEPGDCDPYSEEVSRALDYVAERARRPRGVTLYREGLRTGEVQKLKDGIAFMRRQFGGR